MRDLSVMSLCRKCEPGLTAIIISLSTRAVIGQFSGPYSLVRPAKILEFILLQNCFVIYRQLFLTSIASKNPKLFVTLYYVLKRANDLKTI